MTDKLKFTSATDKDVYDLLMSAKQKMSEKVLRAFAFERGILYSDQSDREKLCESISRLPHDYNSIVKLIDTRDQSTRQEKRTFTVLPVELSLSEIEAVIDNLRDNAEDGDDISLQSRRARGVYMNVEYEEVDYSKTRLMQRQKRDAGVEISVEDGNTIIRTPSSSKAEDIVSGITKEVEKLKLQQVSPVAITMEGLSSEQRSRFFLKLINSLPNYQLRTVVNMRIASDIEADVPNEEIDIEGEINAGSDMIGKVNSMMLSGVNLLQSPEYQNLKKGGFFITSMVWQSEQLSEPRDLFQFDVSFRNGREGTGYRFSARIARRLNGGDFTDNFKPLETNRQPGIWRMIEEASQETLADVKADPDGSGAEP